MLDVLLMASLACFFSVALVESSSISAACRRPLTKLKQMGSGLPECQAEERAADPQRQCCVAERNGACGWKTIR